MSIPVRWRGLVMVCVYGMAACATTSGVIVNPNAQHGDYRSVYIVVHGGSSSDMDANLQKEFLRHGLSVSVGPDGAVSPNVQLVARYADDWKWDVAMYLRSLDVMVFDAKSNVLLAAYFAQGRPAIHGMPVHGFTPCRSSAHEAGRAELSIRDEHSSIV